jgi:CO dehydrogenase maturation factor
MGAGTKIIAVCGKGGVGKTSLSALMVRVLAGDPGKRVLAIDADPAVGLALALGIRIQRTVDDVRNGLIERLKEGKAGSRRELAAALDYEVFEALREDGNIAFLAIGRPESEGCYCQVNDFLREIIESLAGSFDYVVIDGEAGIEQVNRRVMERVTHLAIVSDLSRKGLHVAGDILEVGKRLTGAGRHGLILNRVRDAQELDRVSIPAGLELAGWVPEEEGIREYDMAGKSMRSLPDCAAVRSLRGCLERMGLT